MKLNDETPTIADDGLVRMYNDPFFPHIFKRCGDDLVDLLLASDGDERVRTLAPVAYDLARDTIASGVHWPGIARAIEQAAKKAEISPEATTRALETAYEAALYAPTAWILLARSFVFEAGKNQFVHISSGYAVSVDAFNLEFGCVCPNPGTSLARFLCDGWFIVKVQSVLQGGDCTAEFFLERGRLHLSLPSCTCYETPVPVLYHIDP